MDGDPKLRMPDAGDSLYGSGSSPSNRGLIERRLPSDATSLRVPDVNSARARYPDNSNRHGGGSEFFPPPPPPPIGGRHDRDYWRHARHHYDRYGDLWFGGHHSWRRFIHGCYTAPWFWSHYSYVYSWPWVFGYCEPSVYVNSGWNTPYWYGYSYYPWWSWCDAPFVYFYYRYPARFSFNVTVNSDYYNDDSYYDDSYYEDSDYDGSYDNYDDSYYNIYDGGASVVTAAVDHPLGVWVPGHWEQQYVVDTEWVWVPGYYIY